MCTRHIVWIVALFLFAPIIVLLGVVQVIDLFYEAARRPDVDFLSTDAHFVVGETRIALPFVAVGHFHSPDQPNPLHGLDYDPRARREKSFELAGDAAMPFSASRLQVFVQHYGSHGEYLESADICPRLTREWSRHVCRGDRLGVLDHLPSRFSLSGRGSLGWLDNYWTVGRERRSGHIADMRFEPGVPEIGCDLNSRFCTAALAVTPALLAIWSVWPTEDPPETAHEKALREGRAIFHFVQHGLGETENFALLSGGLDDRLTPHNRRSPPRPRPSL